jgi:hypothetical protein
MLSGFAKPSAASGLIGNARPHPSEARMIDALFRPWKRGIRNRATHACSAKPSFGVFAPSGTPEPLQARLFEVVSNALQEKPTMEKLLIQGIVPRPMTLAGLRSFVRSESEKFGGVAEAAKIRAE